MASMLPVPLARALTPVGATLFVTRRYAWLGHGWKGCSKNYPFPPEFNLDYGTPVDKVCKETAPNSGIFTRAWSNVVVTMDCNKWVPTITWNK